MAKKLLEPKLLRKSRWAMFYSHTYLLNRVTKQEIKCVCRNVMNKHQSVACINKGSFSSSLFESRTYSHYLCIELLAPETLLAALIHRKNPLLHDN